MSRKKNSPSDLRRRVGYNAKKLEQARDDRMADIRAGEQRIEKRMQELLKADDALTRAEALQKAEQENIGKLEEDRRRLWREVYGLDPKREGAPVIRTPASGPIGPHIPLPSLKKEPRLTRSSGRVRRGSM